MSPERAGSPLGMEPQELALALQSAVPPFQLVRLQMPAGHKNEPQIVYATSERNANDDDLTNLTWLQDNNLLKGINLTYVKTDEYDEQTKSSIIAASSQNESQIVDLRVNTNEYQDAHRSPTSDYVDESSSIVSEPNDSSSSSVSSLTLSPKMSANTTVRQSQQFISPQSKPYKLPAHVRYDPKVHTFSKPPYSFSCLIFMAIENSAAKALPVKDIYAWIVNHFPYFKTAPTGWKNSVRHNLSLNKCFQKVEKSPSLGKGSLWMVDETFRPNLIHALTRSPLHSDHSIIELRSSYAAPFVKHTPETTIKRTIVKCESPQKLPVGVNYAVRDLSHVQNVQHIQHVHNLTNRATHVNTRTFDQRLAADTSVATNVRDNRIHLATDRVYHRLGRVYDERPRRIDEIKTEPCDETQNDGAYDDVDIAASAILALKHSGQTATVRRNSCDSSDGSSGISRSGSDDHIYTSNNPAARSYSPDEAFESDSENVRHTFADDDEEQRRIKEGADALLNLAGVRTDWNRSDHRQHYQDSNSYSNTNTSCEYYVKEEVDIKEEVDDTYVKEEIVDEEEVDDASRKRCRNYLDDYYEQKRARTEVHENFYVKEEVVEADDEQAFDRDGYYDTHSEPLDYDRVKQERKNVVVISPLNNLNSLNHSTNVNSLNNNAYDLSNKNIVLKKVIYSNLSQLSQNQKIQNSHHQKVERGGANGYVYVEATNVRL